MRVALAKAWVGDYVGASASLSAGDDPGWRAYILVHAYGLGGLVAPPRVPDGKPLEWLVSAAVTADVALDDTGEVLDHLLRDAPIHDRWHRALAHAAVSAVHVGRGDLERGGRTLAAAVELTG